MRIIKSALKLIAVGRDGCALIVFFLAPWWLRQTWGLPGDPYFLRFTITAFWALTVIGWALTGFGERWRWRRLLLWLAPWVTFIVWTFMSSWWAAFPNPAWDAASQSLAIGLFAVVMAMAAPPIRWIIGALGAGGIFQAIIAIGQTTLQRPIGLTIFGEFEVRPAQAGLSVLKVNGQNWLRPYGLTAHPNILGGFLAVAALALFAVLVLKGLSRRHQWLMGVTFAVTLWGLFLTFSRAAWGGVVVGGLALVAVWAWRARDRIDWPRARLIVMGGAALTAIFVASHRDLVFARAGLGDETGELRSISDRALFTEYALRMIGQSPLIGLGAGMNSWAAAQMILNDPRQIDMQAQPVHNVILLWWSETGLVGVGFWLASVIGAGWIILRSRESDPLVYGLAACGIALAAIGMLDYYMWSLFPTALLWWGVVGAALHAALVKSPLVQAEATTT